MMPGEKLECNSVEWVRERKHFLTESAIISHILGFKRETKAYRELKEVARIVKATGDPILSDVCTQPLIFVFNQHITFYNRCDRQANQSPRPSLTSSPRTQFTDKLHLISLRYKLG